MLGQLVIYLWTHTIASNCIYWAMGMHFVMLNMMWMRPYKVTMPEAQEYPKMTLDGEVAGTFPWEG